ncbi:MAG: endolytic transglycosylase MltG [Anaerolineales bacterium]|nr:endolytic transglycosylase MltG [Anaerolineales bacterium]
MQKERSRGCRVLFVFLIICLACSVISAAAAAVIGVPYTTARIGAAAPELDAVQRFLLTTYLMLNLEALRLPVGEPSEVYDLEVLPGESVSAVASRLEEAGWIPNSTLLRNYMRYRGMDRGMEAGKYTLYGWMTVRQLAEALQRAQVDQSLFTVVEGLRREQIASSIALSSPTITESDFIQATSSWPATNPLIGEIPAGASMEGFLFPDSYSLEPDMTAQELTQSMLDNFEVKVGPEFREGFLVQGLSLYEAVILASIVEREAVVPEERELIASVFLNRLSTGMRLEADPTVQYALGQQADGEWWKAPLDIIDLGINSPYNTYLNFGLPPGPISNPGLGSLKAVAFPADSTYFYFRARCDGTGRHAFAETFEEHQQNACP